ncbi:Crp/Fnr family transcriptional regulator [Crocosphaera chwakensis]|uniref:Possible Transcriptional Regulator, Crp/Fnr family protein n=1 Tax=Crocosphaera chwakensis CCY0110 TaxID=391612 RepID=A3IKS6_9CHRO|nr:Crp/Fnr family transcriptional regulator [Crocosphaera chwakensis]EAZ92795.1 Possible Transcriptional Regulator, Crp/Fnr family protein [Crocosphaera chwakensis CCY0110]
MTRRESHYFNNQSDQKFSSESLLTTQKEAPFNNLKELYNWGRSHCRQRIFHKDQIIPTRPGLLYLVNKGAVRLMGSACINEEHQPREDETIEEIFLGILGVNKPFEIVEHSYSIIRVEAHIEQTSVIWLYWHELVDSLNIYIKVLELFRQQHQTQLIWMSILAQKRTIDRLMGLLMLLATEEGERTEKGYLLPYILTHAQIASAIGTTRVNVTRLMGQLRQQGIIEVDKNNRIFWKMNRVETQFSL